MIIPTRPAILDLDAIGATTDLVSEVRSSTVIVLNACPPPKLFGEPHIVREAREALKHYGLPVCELAISQRAAFGHALIDGQTVAEFEPGGKAAREIARLWDITKLEMGL